MPPFVRAPLDYYSVLEIGPSAGTVEVNAAFRRLAWRYHPDRNPAPGATLQFQDINQAHQVLSDPERRAEYERRRDCGPRRDTAGPARAVRLEPRPFQRQRRLELRPGAEVVVEVVQHGR